MGTPLVTTKLPRRENAGSWNDRQTQLNTHARPQHCVWERRLRNNHCRKMGGIDNQQKHWQNKFYSRAAISLLKSRITNNAVARQSLNSPNLTSGQWEEMFQICATCLEKKLSFIDWHNSLNLTNRVNNFNVQRVKTLCKNCLSRLQSPFDRLWNNKQHMIKYTQNFFIATFTTLRDDLAPSF